jgi:hypothetical protein
VTTRVLPVEEWATLKDNDLATTVAYLNPENTQVVVVEDNGEIVGCWAVLRLVHVEGLWIAPSHRKRASVVRSLFVAMCDAVRRFNTTTVMTGVMTDDVRRLLRHVNAQKVEVEQYVFNIGEKTWQQ